MGRLVIMVHADALVGTVPSRSPLWLELRRLPQILLVLVRRTIN